VPRLTPAPQIRRVSRRQYCALYKFTYLLTYLLTYFSVQSVSSCPFDGLNAAWQLIRRSARSGTVFTTYRCSHAWSNKRPCRV